MGAVILQEFQKKIGRTRLGRRIRPVGEFIRYPALSLAFACLRNLGISIRFLTGGRTSY